VLDMSEVILVKSVKTQSKFLCNTKDLVTKYSLLRSAPPLGGGFC
jgi:hypothetical protein